MFLDLLSYSEWITQTCGWNLVHANEPRKKHVAHAFDTWKVEFQEWTANNEKRMQIWGLWVQEYLRSWEVDWLHLHMFIDVHVKHEQHQVCLIQNGCCPATTPDFWRICVFACIQTHGFVTIPFFLRRLWRLHWPQRLGLGQALGQAHRCSTIPSIQVSDWYIYTYIIFYDKKTSYFPFHHQAPPSWNPVEMV